MNAADRLTQFILEKSEHEPLHVRISLYTDAAEVLADEGHAKALASMVTDLRAAETKHQQLMLDFKRRAEG